jgi:hypothetical protein
MAASQIIPDYVEFLPYVSVALIYLWRRRLEWFSVALFIAGLRKPVKKTGHCSYGLNIFSEK